MPGNPFTLQVWFLRTGGPGAALESGLGGTLRMGVKMPYAIEAAGPEREPLNPALVLISPTSKEILTQGRIFPLGCLLKIKINFYKLLKTR